MQKGCYSPLEMARPERFELPTPRFEAWCSIQLSYGRARGAKYRVSILASQCLQARLVQVVSQEIARSS